MAARTWKSRGMYARRGLATRAPLDKSTQALLLRQLYLSLYEARQFEQAYDIALQAIELNVLPDVLCQDAARAALASGHLERALMHYRAAARRGPASRRPFHLWALGSALFLAERHGEAASALMRAMRWATKDKPLYAGHLALAQLAAGQTVPNLRDITAQLAEAPCGQGYGRFVLGHLAFAAGEWALAKRHLESFVQRTSALRPALGIALEGELRMARATLSKLCAN